MVGTFMKMVETDGTQNVNVICKTFVQRQATLEGVRFKGGGFGLSAPMRSCWGHS